MKLNLLYSMMLKLNSRNQLNNLDLTNPVLFNISGQSQAKKLFHSILNYFNQTEFMQLIVSIFEKQFCRMEHAAS